MNDILILPIIIYLFFGALAVVVLRFTNWQKIISLGAGTLAVGVSLYLLNCVIKDGTQVMQLGGLIAPFGITLVMDRFSAAMVLISNLLGLSCLFYSISEIDLERVKFGFHPVILVLMAGVNGALLAGDLFNLYVWFEVMLISSFVLLTLGSEREQLKGALPYVAINLFSSSLFLTGIGAIYGITGSLNLAQLALHMKDFNSSGLVSSISILFLIAFGIKAAIFPLFFWLPVSYHTPPVTISAIFAGLLTKVAIYSLIRVMTLIFVGEHFGELQKVLIFISGVTMVTGVLGAAAQNEFKKILSFHIISQIGYMLMGLALYTPLAMAGAVLFIIHNIVVKSNLFLISGAVYRLTGSFELKLQGGLYRSQVFLAILFLACAFSLAGLPPLSGFWGKLILASAALKTSHYILAGVSLGVGLFTLYSMTKIWLQTFWKPAPRGVIISAENIQGFLLPITLLAIISLLPAIYPGPLINYFVVTGEELMEPGLYIQAVLSSGGGR